MTQSLTASRELFLAVSKLLFDLSLEVKLKFNSRKMSFVHMSGCMLCSVACIINTGLKSEPTAVN